MSSHLNAAMKTLTLRPSPHVGIADVIDMHPYVVTYPPRPAAGSDQSLCAVCRGDHLDGAAGHLFELSEMARRVETVEPWDYRADARAYGMSY